MGVFEDPPPVLGGDFTLLCDAVGHALRKIELSLALSRHANLSAGDEIDSLRFESAVVDPNAEAGIEQMFVSDGGPLLAPLDEFCAGVPFPVFRAEPLWGQLPRG